MNIASGRSPDPVTLFYNILQIYCQRMVRRVEACPPPDTGRGRGPLTASYREAMTQMAMGGAGESEANGVLHPPYHPLSVCTYKKYSD